MKFIYTPLKGPRHMLRLPRNTRGGRMWYLMPALILGLILAALLMISSCDIIEAPYGQNAVIDPGDTSKLVQKVLLEDLTGHTCVNCPDAAEEAERIHKLYGDRVVVVAVHTGFFAKPKFTPDSSFYYDFRTQAGEELNAYYKIDNAGLPKGMINRRVVGSSPLLSHPAWAAEVASVLALEPRFKLKLSPTYDAGARQGNIQVQVENKGFTEPGIPLNLVVYILEDSIVNWQKKEKQGGGSENVPNYLHRHVLRKCLTPTFGVGLSGIDAPGATASQSFTINLGADWKAKDCSFVAFIHRDDTKEVLQTEYVKLY